LRGYLDTKTSIFILFFANLVNFCLDIILIAYFKLGVVGAAIATTTAEWISAALFLGVLAGRLPSSEGELGSQSSIKILPKSSIPPWSQVEPLITASSSLFLRSFALQASLSVASALAARGGSAEIAAHQIALQVWMLCSYVCDSLAVASQSLVADAMGRNSSRDVVKISKTILRYSAVLGVFLALVLKLGNDSNFLIGFFSNDSSTQTALRNILVFLIFAQPLNSLVFAADGILQGASEFTFQAKSMAFSVAFAGLTYYILQSFLGNSILIHIWSALIVLQLMRGITSFLKLRKIIFED